MPIVESTVDRVSENQKIDKATRAHLTLIEGDMVRIAAQGCLGRELVDMIVCRRQTALLRARTFLFSLPCSTEAHCHACLFC